VGRDAEPVPTDPGSAKAALDRISIPQDVLDRIGNIMPRSSVIVTDEALSPETGKGTDFVVLFERRAARGHRETAAAVRGLDSANARPRSIVFWRSPFGNSFSAWWRPFFARQTPLCETEASGQADRKAYRNPRICCDA